MVGKLDKNVMMGELTRNVFQDVSPRVVDTIRRLDKIKQGGMLNFIKKAGKSYASLLKRA